MSFASCIDSPAKNQSHWTSLVCKVRSESRVSDRHIKLAMLALLPTLYSIYLSFPIYLNQLMLVNVKSRHQKMHGDYISRLHALFNELICNDTTKMKLAMLAFLFCGEFVKNSSSSLLRTWFQIRVPSILEKVSGSKWLGSHAGCQEIGLRWYTGGESVESIAQGQWSTLVSNTFLQQI